MRKKIQPLEKLSQTWVAVARSACGGDRRRRFSTLGPAWGTQRGEQERRGQRERKVVGKVAGEREWVHVGDRWTRGRKARAGLWAATPPSAPRNPRGHGRAPPPGLRRAPPRFSSARRRRSEASAPHQGGPDPSRPLTRGGALLCTRRCCPHPNSPHPFPAVAAAAAAAAEDASLGVAEIQAEPSCAGGPRRREGRRGGGAGWRRGRRAGRRRHLPGRGAGAARRLLGARGGWGPAVARPGAAKCKQSAMISLFS